MKPDITTRAQLEDLLARFYEQALQDAEIGFFFTQVAPLNMATHLPRITDFWEAVVLGTRGYGKNVMELHRHLHGLSPIRKAHLDRWVQLFTQTIANGFEGPNATLMAQRATSIATMMNLKLNHGGVGGREVRL